MQPTAHEIDRAVHRSIDDNSQAEFEEAIAKAETLALRVIADRLEHGERAPALNNLFVAA